MRAVLLVGAWLAAGATSLFVASTTAIGPTILSFDAYLGVQAGDVAFTAATAGAAALATRRVLPLPDAELRALLAVGAWLAASGFTLVVAARSAIGPVVVTLSTNHGVHSGDVLFGVAAAATAVLVTALLLSPRDHAGASHGPG